MMSDRQIIDGCARHERKAQKELYRRYSRLLLGICIRYAGNRAEAEDILQESFLKIFFRIKDFTGTGSFEGWMKKVVVNTAITSYHANLKHRYHEDIDDYISIETGDSGFEEDFFSAEELLMVLNELPKGYRLIFNLYAVEGYKHREIAELLGIDQNTSKSQYSRAKAVLRTRLLQLRNIKDSYPADNRDI